MTVGARAPLGAMPSAAMVLTVHGDVVNYLCNLNDDKG